MIWLLSGAPAGHAASPGEYVIGTGDSLRIDVFEHPDISGEGQVAADGTISLSLVGRIEAVGRTLAQLEAAVAERLIQVHLYRDPVVVAKVTEYRPIYVAGWVRTPGRFTYTPGMTVRQALALGGGYGPPRSASTTETRMRQQQIGAIKSLRTSNRLKLHLLAQLSRLTAEQEGRDTLEVPGELAQAERAVAGEILAGERSILQTRRQAMADRMKAIDDQEADLRSEIEALKARDGSITRTIASHREELRDAESLQAKGFARKTQIMEIERRMLELTSLLHETTAEVLRANVELGALRRDRIEIASVAREAVEADRLRTLLELETANAEIAAAGSVLSELEAADGVDAATLSGDAAPRLFLHRRRGEVEESIAVDEGALLSPGDTVEVRLFPNLENPVAGGQPVLGNAMR